MSTGRRIVSLVVVAFAALGFLAVPIGDKTGYEHARFILATREAAHIGKSLSELAQTLKATLTAEIERVGAVKDGPADD